MIAARLIAATRPVADTGLNTGEDLIAYCARVSNPANQNNPDTMGLLRYLIRHRHWSPFEMAHAVVEVECPRDIARQILRHRSFSFQEFSQRYAEVLADPEFRQARLQDHKNRQSSIQTDDAALHAAWMSSQVRVWDAASEAYKAALAAGIAKEVARALLPEGLTPSRLYMAGSLRSFIHYLDVREGNGTQAEHVEVARAIRAALVQEFPNVMGVAG